MAEHDASRAVQRLERLQQLVAALSRATSVDQVSDAVVDAAMAQLQANAALVAVLNRDKTRLEILRAVGYRDETVDQWKTFPLDAPLPSTDAIRHRKMVVLESVKERDELYPVLRGLPTSHEAFAIVPLIAAGEPLGIASFGFDDPRRLEADERAFLQAVTDQCAQALHRAQLYEKERLAAERQAFLARASRRLVGWLDVDQLAAELARLLVPQIADACFVHVANHEGLRPVGIAHADPGQDAALRRLAADVEYSRSPQVFDVQRTEAPVAVSEIPEDYWKRAGLNGEQADALRDAAFTSGVVVPLTARGRSVGVLSVAMTGPDRRFTDDDLPFVLDLAAFAALALDNAHLFEERSRIAETLQMTLLPPSLPHIEGVELGASYRAAGAGTEVGGDFYDVFRADTDRWILALGDVRGRGSEAAATTGLARHAMRAVAFGSVSVVDIAANLNRVLLDWHREHVRETEPRFCAVIVAAYSPSKRLLTVCTAGNPPPLLLHADGSCTEIGGAGTVAGVVEDPDLAQAEVTLQPGDTFVAFTDGISERHTGALFFDDVLHDRVAELAQRPAQELADQLRFAAEDYTTAPPTDDMAVITLQVRD